jgi:hypothetical protein
LGVGPELEAELVFSAPLFDGSEVSGGGKLASDIGVSSI